MSTITIQRPGFAVGFAAPETRRFAPRAPQNLHAIGYFARGAVSQVRSVTDLRSRMGARTSDPLVELTHDMIAAALAEAGGATVTVSRILGPAAAASSLTLDDGDDAPSIKITASSPGEWGNALKAQVTISGTGRIITITDADVPVATSPVCADVAAIAAWGELVDAVDVELLGTDLPAAVAATALTGGSADLANVTVDNAEAALAALDARYGEGVLIAPATDVATHAAILEHCAAFNRRARLTLPVGTSQGDAISHVQSLRAAVPEAVKRGGVFASWRTVTPVAGEPPRLVPWAALQAGIDSRIIREHGVATPSFGPTAGASRLTGLLSSEWSTAERAALYAGGVNVATDDGLSVASWGFVTADAHPLHADLHHQTVLMALQAEAEQILRSKVGVQGDSDSLSSLHGQIEGTAASYKAERALWGYRVLVDEVNTPATLAARELHAAIEVQQTPTSDWVDLLVSVRHPTETL